MIICWFSCGVASAVATKLICSSQHPNNIAIYNAYVAEESQDNRRFLADCEKWFGLPITVLRDTKYGASAREVWRRERYIKGPEGASCSMRLKRELLERVFQPGDIPVFGFTVEERERAKRFLDAGACCPLIEHNLTKADCLAMVERAGIELPWSYRAGFNNGNCLGCCNGGQGYWNLVREIAPAVFEETAQIQDELGPGSYFWQDSKTRERISLRQLNPEAGRHSIVVPECSLFCAMAEDQMGPTDAT